MCINAQMRNLGLQGMSMRRLHKVGAATAPLHVLAHNLRRVITLLSPQQFGLGPCSVGKRRITIRL